MALRELALRRIADRVDAAARAALGPDPGLARLAGAGPGPGRHRPGPAGRAAGARRQAPGRRARCRTGSVIYVETPALLRLSEARAQPAHRPAAPGRVARRRDRDARRADRGRGDERIRADAPGEPRAGRRAEAARLARAGCGPRPRPTLVRRARGFDVITIAEERGRRRPCARTARRRRRRQPSSAGSGYGWALLTTATCTVLGFAMYPSFELTNLVDGLPARRDDRGAAVRARPRGR